MPEAYTPQDSDLIGLECGQDSKWYNFPDDSKYTDVRNALS